ncbi:MAG: response regulator transcription factor [Planctomycetes bacterium]|nr:response regulator transcription factor [Planctomycetota bacterium]
MRVLVVEDDPKVARSVERGLREEGYEAQVAERGDDASRLLAQSVYDFVVLDLNLPGKDGLDVLRELRTRGVATPVLVLTARDAVEQRVAGLEAGADDYLVKPFAFAELLARLRAQLRRGRGGEVLKLRCAQLEMDLVTRTVHFAGRAVEMTQREQDVLELLLRHAGKPVSREILAREVWKTEERDSAIENLIEVVLARVRKKLTLAGGEGWITTLRGVGYQLAAKA